MFKRFVSPLSSLLFAAILAAGAGANAHAGSIGVALNAADYLLNVGFTDGTLGLLSPSGDGNATASVLGGSVVIELDRYEDPIPYRTELVPKRLPAQAFDSGKFAHIGEEYWYGIRIFVPTTWVADNSYEVVTQWHGANSGPGVSLRMDNPGVSAGLHAQTEIADHWLLMVTGKPFDLGLVASSAGKWVDWVFRIRWSPSTGGRITVWRNKLWVTDVRRPTMYADQYGPYWKFGIYKSPWKQVPTLVPIQSHRTLLFDNVRIGQGAGIAIHSF
jgi:Polysaccharide lyase